MRAGSKAGVGWSRLSQSDKAGSEAAGKALEGCGGLPPVFALVYATVLYDHKEILKGVRSVLPPKVPVVGCSTQGISRPGGVEEVDRVVGVAVLASRAIRAGAGCVKDISKDPRGSGRKLAGQLGPLSPSSFDFLWYDPLGGVNVDALLQGLADEGHDRIIGGAAGSKWDGPQEATQQFFNDQVLTDAVVGLRVEGAHVAHGVSHGTEPVGLEMTATEAKGNVIFSINGRPAMDVWMEHLGGGVVDDHDTRISWALGLALPTKARGSYDDFLIAREVMEVDKEKRSLSIQAEIPSGARVHVCHRTQKSVFDRALAMAERLKRQLKGKKPLLALSFECGARPRPFLGDDMAREEVLAVQRIIGPDIPWLGEYAWGEIAPIGKKCYFYNFTFPLAILCENP